MLRVSDLTVLQEIFLILEADQVKLSNYLLNQDRTKLLVKINGKEYEFTPTDVGAIPLFNSFAGMAKHSHGKALAYLKKHATGKLIK